MTIIEDLDRTTVRGTRLHRVSSRRWRVLDRAGRVIGHIRASREAGATRYHAEKFDLARARMRELGSFWSVDDAVDCVRYLR